VDLQHLGTIGMVKTMRTALAVRPISLGARGPAPTDREAGSAERARLYQSARWQRARLRFLRANPLCIACTARGCWRIGAQ
jgi:hypothetical protein